MNWKRKDVKAGGKLLKPNFAKFTNIVLRLDLGRGRWEATGMTLSTAALAPPTPPSQKLPPVHTGTYSQTWAEGRGVGVVAGAALHLRKRNHS